MLLDLTVPLSDLTPVYPGDPSPKIDAAGVLEKDGYEDHVIHVGTHLGTHMDAPSHMISGGKNLDAYPIEKFTGRGVCIPAVDGFSLEKVKTAGIKEGDIVFFHTGMSDRYTDPAYFTDFPEVPSEVAAYLIEKKIAIAGFDMCSPDRPPFPIHKMLLGADILIIENLTGLAALAGKEFRAHAYPMKLALDGAPVRVVAESL